MCGQPADQCCEVHGKGKRYRRGSPVWLPEIGEHAGSPLQEKNASKFRWQTPASAFGKSTWGNFSSPLCGSSLPMNRLFPARDWACI